MTQRPASTDPREWQAYLLTVTAELQQIEASLSRMRDCTERLLAATEPPGPQRSPLEQMYEDLERAIRARASPEPAPRVPPAHAVAPPASQRMKRVALQVVASSAPRPGATPSNPR